MSRGERSGRDTAGTLLTAAKDCFLAAGYEKTTVRDICAAAGVSVGAFYYSFPDKEAVFAALVGPAKQDLERCLSAGRPDELLPLLLEHREGLCLLLEKSGGSSFEDFPDRVRDRFEQLLFHYSEKTGAGEPDPALSRIFANLCLSVLKDLAECSCDRAELRRIAHALQTFLEGGFRALPAQPRGNG